MMDEALRKLRGLLGTATTWGLAWGAIGALIGLVAGIVAPEIWLAGNPIVQWALGMGAYGIVSGLGFGALLGVYERRRSLSELSPARAALWGVAGSSVVPILFGMMGMFEAGTTLIDVVQAVVVTATLGGGFAGGSVVIARNAEIAERRSLMLPRPADRDDLADRLHG